MQSPKKILNQTDFETQLENLQNALQNLRTTYESLNQSFYQFLEQNPEIRDRYREFASGHPEETWDFHAETYAPSGSARESESKEEHQDEATERMQETESRDMPGIY